MARAETTATGQVALIGGGPAQDDLITVRGRELLRAADVVVADRLGPRGLLEELRRERPEVQIIDVGKAPGCHSASQEEINRLLVEHARAGWQVVRLKGGDPYILGRGSEERAHCRRHGVAVEVVPGITSAVAVPAEVGIPLTHRTLSRGFTVVTGHDDLAVVPGPADTSKPYLHTLVILMGVSTLRRTATQLMVDGHDAATPVAIIESGGTEEQRLTLGRLGTVADLAAERGVRNPAVIVVGEVVTLADGWAEDLTEAAGPGQRAAQEQERASEQAPAP